MKSLKSWKKTCTFGEENNFWIMKKMVKQISNLCKEIAGGHHENGMEVDIQGTKRLNIPLSAKL